MVISSNCWHSEFRVLINGRRPAKKTATSSIVPPTFPGNRGKWEKHSIAKPPTLTFSPSTPKLNENQIICSILNFFLRVFLLQLKCMHWLSKTRKNSTLACFIRLVKSRYRVEPRLSGLFDYPDFSIIRTFSPVPFFSWILIRFDLKRFQR